ncbi:diphosphomevalonate decarboxylase [Tupaia chinensis]|uniref:diphosphomevalonate decarboxylase n=1 Tax=Tupaia chinensis TaxID=246437 RepID=UPI00070452BD|nr:diphosphomevalonate decarboxylase [Tupaia chinensis]
MDLGRLVLCRGLCGFTVAVPGAAPRHRGCAGDRAVSLQLCVCFATGFLTSWRLAFCDRLPDVYTSELRAGSLHDVYTSEPRAGSLHDVYTSGKRRQEPPEVVKRTAPTSLGAAAVQQAGSYPDLSPGSASPPVLPVRRRGLEQEEVWRPLLVLPRHPAFQTHLSSCPATIAFETLCSQAHRGDVNRLGAYWWASFSFCLLDLCLPRPLPTATLSGVLWLLHRGKRDEELVLPINSSLSVTLHQDQLKTTTTAVLSKDFTADRLWLNGQEEDVGQPRLQACLREIRRLARKRRSTRDRDSPPLSLSYKVHVASVNNFPTAAGLASSAAGYACLAYALARVYGVESDLSEVARRGSGRACRSLYGGFVEWQMGQQADGKDSVARQVAPESHWPELRVLILVVSAERKPTGSTAGMRTSVETSPLLRFRAESVVPARMAEMIHCIRERDFPGFAQLTMRDSNQFHATCLDTFPPISYLSDTSRRIMHLVHCFNAHHGQTKAAYTFDAGPNAVVFTLDDTVAEFVAAVRHSFPPASNADEFLKGLQVGPALLSEELKAALAMEPSPGAIRYVIATQVGPGPQVLDDPHTHLLGPDGLPKLGA